MKKSFKAILIILSFIALAMTVVPAFLVFANVISLQEHKHYMFAGTIIWFATAPFWMGKKKDKTEPKQSE